MSLYERVAAWWRREATPEDDAELRRKAEVFERLEAAALGDISPSESDLQIHRVQGVHGQRVAIYSAEGLWLSEAIEYADNLALLTIAQIDEGVL